MRVLAADPLKQAGVRAEREAVDRIAASKRKLVFRRERVPQILQLDRRVRPSALPEQILHLPVHQHGFWAAVATARQVSDHPANRVLKPTAIRQSVRHERRQGLPRVEHPEPFVTAQPIDVESVGRQVVDKRRAVGAGGDDERRLAGVQSGGQAFADRAL